MMQYHPDKNPNCGDCKEKFNQLNKAYDVLKDGERRKLYDQTFGQLKPIKSQTVELTKNNYEHEVLLSGKIWVV